ncbi:MAG: HAD hydrolase-like protein [Candidatus Omnitrophica bacterium]|nr:HAD hydrolase-like protein [Candidatus Omnitrophota bacterium]
MERYKDKKRFKAWIRFTAAAVACLFIANDIVWANPDIASATGHAALSAASYSQAMNDAQRAEFAVKAFRSANLFGNEKLHLYPTVNGKRVDIFYDPVNKQPGGYLIVPCDVGGVEFDVLVNEEDDSVLAARKDANRPSAIPAAKEAREKDAVRNAFREAMVKGLGLPAEDPKLKNADKILDDIGALYGWQLLANVTTDRNDLSIAELNALAKRIWRLYSPTFLSGDEEFIGKLKAHAQSVAAAMEDWARGYLPKSQTGDRDKIVALSRIIALAHDIGKAISAEKLALHYSPKQKAKMTEYERRIIHEHSRDAFMILERYGVRLPPEAILLIAVNHEPGLQDRLQKLNRDFYDKVLALSMSDKFCAFSERRSYMSEQFAGIRQKIMADRPDDPARVIFVCSMNAARSPLAEFLARLTADELNLAHPRFMSGGITVVAGDKEGLFLGVKELVHAQNPPEVVDRIWGKTGFKARSVDSRDLQDADLVVISDEMSRRELANKFPGLGARLADKMVSFEQLFEEAKNAGAALPDISEWTRQLTFPDLGDWTEAGRQPEDYYALMQTVIRRSLFSLPEGRDAPEAPDVRDERRKDEESGTASDSAASFYQKVKDFIYGVRNIRFRFQNPVVTVELAGTGERSPAGFRWPIAMYAEAERTQATPQQEEMHTIQPEEQEEESITLSWSDLEREPAEEGVGATDYLDKLGRWASQDIAEGITPQMTAVEKFNTVDGVLKTVTGAKDIKQSSWIMRTRRMMPEGMEMEQVSRGLLRGHIEPVKLRRRIETVVGTGEAVSPLAELFKSLQGSLKTQHARMYVGSQTGYFQVEDTDKAFPHKIDIVIVTNDNSPAAEWTINEDFMKMVRSQFKGDVIEKVRLRIVGAEKLASAFRDDLLTVDKIKERAELQRLFVELYREYICVAGTPFSSESKAFHDALYPVECAYVQGQILLMGRGAEELEGLKRDKAVLAQDPHLAELASQLQRRESDLDNLWESIDRVEYDMAKIDDYGRFFAFDKRLKELKASVPRMNAQQQEQYLRAVEAHNKKLIAYQRYKSMHGSLSREYAAVEADIKRLSAKIADRSAPWAEKDAQIRTIERQITERGLRVEDAQAGRLVMLPGSVIHDRYVLVNELGRGGSSIVYRASDMRRGPKKGIELAIKMVDPRHAESLKNFRLETGWIEEFTRAPIPRSKYDDGTYAGLPYFAMTLQKGKSLYEIMRGLKTGRIKMSMWERIVLIHALAKIVVEFHERTPLIHCDLKPGNIIMHTDDQGRFFIPKLPENVDRKVKARRRAMPAYLKKYSVKRLALSSCVLDLGIARILQGVSLDSEEDQEGQFAQVQPAEPSQEISRGIGGTPRYMAPEQCDVEKAETINRRSDTYAFGVICYELLTAGCYPVGNDVYDKSDRALERILLAKTDENPKWPNDMLRVRKIAFDDLARLKAMDSELVRRMIETQVIVGSDGKKTEWQKEWRQKIPAETILRWNRKIVANERKLRRWLKNVRGVTESNIEEIVGIIIRPEVPDEVAGLVVAMLNKYPEARPGSEEILEELEKIVTGQPRERLKYLPPWLERSAFSRFATRFLKYPSMLLTMLLTGAIGAGFYMYEERQVALNNERAARQRADQADNKMRMDLERVRKEAAEAGLADTSGSLEDVRERIRQKRDAEAKKRLDVMTAEVGEAQKRADQLKEDVAKRSAEVSKLAEDAKKKTAEAASAKARMDEANRSLAALNIRKGELDRQIGELQQQVARLKERTALDAEVARLKQELEKTKSDLDAARAKLEAMKEGVDTSGTAAEIRARIEEKRKLEREKKEEPKKEGSIERKTREGLAGITGGKAMIGIMALLGLSLPSIAEGAEAYSVSSPSNFMVGLGLLSAAVLIYSGWLIAKNVIAKFRFAGHLSHGSLSPSVMAMALGRDERIVGKFAVFAGGIPDAPLGSSPATAPVPAHKLSKPDKGNMRSREFVELSKLLKADPYFSWKAGEGEVRSRVEYSDLMDEFSVTPVEESKKAYPELAALDELSTLEGVPDAGIFGIITVAVSEHEGQPALVIHEVQPSIGFRHIQPVETRRKFYDWNRGALEHIVKLASRAGFRHFYANTFEEMKYNYEKRLRMPIPNSNLKQNYLYPFRGSWEKIDVVMDGRNMRLWHREAKEPVETDVTGDEYRKGKAVSDVREIRALIFDMDGTLTNGEAFAPYYDACYLALIAQKRPDIAPDEALKRRKETRSWTTPLIEYGLSLEDYDRMLVDKVPVTKLVKPDPAMKLLVGKLSTKYKLAVLTNNVSGITEKILEALEIRGMFGVIMSCAKAGTVKPDPKIFAMTCAELDVPSGQAVSIGDKYEKDIAPAESMGMIGISVADPSDLVGNLEKRLSQIPVRSISAGSTKDELIQSQATAEPKGALGDISSAMMLARCLKEETVSSAFSGKLVLAFESNVAMYQNNSPLKKLLEALEELKKHPRYKGMLGNLELVMAPAEKLPGELNKYKDDRHANVFVFATEDKETRKKLERIEGKVNRVYIKEKDEKGARFHARAYYPIAEIVVITLAQHFDKLVKEGETARTLNIDGKPFELCRVNIESLSVEEGGAIIMSLVPDAVPYDNEKDLVQRYAAMKPFLEAA